jgi:hypothetical protein
MKRIVTLFVCTFLFAAGLPSPRQAEAVCAKVSMQILQEMTGGLRDIL